MGVKSELADAATIFVAKLPQELRFTDRFARFRLLMPLMPRAKMDHAMQAILSDNVDDAQFSAFRNIGSHLLLGEMDLPAPSCGIILVAILDQ